jgi:hypothetical protein
MTLKLQDSIEQAIDIASFKQSKRPKGISIIDDDSLNPEKSLKVALEKLIQAQATESDLSKKDGA